MMMGMVKIILATPIAVWSFVSIIMILEGENKGQKPANGFDWILNHSPRWYKRVTFFVILPLFIVLLMTLCSRKISN